MLDRLKELVPSYFIDKHSELAEKQVENLPIHLRKAIVYGTEEEAAQAFEDIRQMERLRGKWMLGEAGKELINDMRHSAQSDEK